MRVCRRGRRGLRRPREGEMEAGRDSPRRRTSEERSPPAPPTSSSRSWSSSMLRPSRSRSDVRADKTALDCSGTYSRTSARSHPFRSQWATGRNVCCEADLVEPLHELDLGPGRGLENPVGLHEQALVVHERGVAHERLDEAHAVGALSPCGCHSQQPGRQLLVGEGVVAQHVARHRRRTCRAPPLGWSPRTAGASAASRHPTRTWNGRFADSDDHARQPRPPVEQDLEIGEPERGPNAAVETRHVEPGTMAGAGDRGRRALRELTGAGGTLSAPRARTSRCRKGRA